MEVLGRRGHHRFFFVELEHAVRITPAIAAGSVGYNKKDKRSTDAFHWSLSVGPRGSGFGHCGFVP